MYTKAIIVFFAAVASLCAFWGLLQEKQALDNYEEHSREAVSSLEDDQQKLLEKQRETYVPFEENEENYYKQTNPSRDAFKDEDFLMKDHPLQEKPLPDKGV